MSAALNSLILKFWEMIYFEMAGYDDKNSVKKLVK